MFTEMSISFDIETEINNKKSKKKSKHTENDKVSVKEEEYESYIQSEDKKIEKDNHVELITQPKIVGLNSFIQSVMDTDVKNRSKYHVDDEAKGLIYDRAELMTTAEKQLFHLLKHNLVFKYKVEIFAKVRLADVVNIKDGEVDKSLLYNIAAKHVDFVICNKNTLETICVVELDDFTHYSDKVIHRDKFVEAVLKDAGINLVRISTNMCDITEKDIRCIDTLIGNKMAPECPGCGGDMHVLESKKSWNRGHRFYGCNNYPKCKVTIDID